MFTTGVAAMCHGLLPKAPKPAIFGGTPSFTNSRQRVVPPAYGVQRFQISCRSRRRSHSSNSPNTLGVSASRK